MYLVEIQPNMLWNKQISVPYSKVKVSDISSRILDWSHY